MAHTHQHPHFMLAQCTFLHRIPTGGGAVITIDTDTKFYVIDDFQRRNSEKFAKRREINIFVLNELSVMLC